MLRKFWPEDHRPAFHDVAGSTTCVRNVVRMAILRMFQAGFLLACGGIVIVSTAEPVATVGEAPSWSIATGHRRSVKAVAFSPDGRRLATGGEDGCIVVWRPGEGIEQELPCQHLGGVIAVAFSRDGATLASAHAEHDVVLWDVTTGRELTKLTGHAGLVLSFDFFPDGATVATASRDRTIRLWDVASGRNKTVLSGHSGAVRTIRVSPDGRTLASSSTEGVVKLWDVASGDCRRSLASDRIGLAVDALAFSPDGLTLATAGVCRKIRFWEVATGRKQTDLRTNAENTRNIAYSADGQTAIIMKYDDLLLINDINTISERTIVLGAFNTLCSAFSPDGLSLALGDMDGTVRVWDLNRLVNNRYLGPRRTSASHSSSA